MHYISTNNTIFVIYVIVKIAHTFVTIKQLQKYIYSQQYMKHL